MAECAACGEEFERLFAPPTVAIPRSQLSGYEDGSEYVEWHAPGQGYPGAERFYVLGESDEAIIAEHWESAGSAVCWQCYAGGVWPALVPYLHNRPRQIVFHGWRKAEWIET